MGLEHPETQGRDEMQLTLSGGVLWGNIIIKLMCALSLNQEVSLTEKKRGPPGLGLARNQLVQRPRGLSVMKWVLPSGMRCLSVSLWEWDSVSRPVSLSRTWVLRNDAVLLNSRDKA